MSFGKTSSNWWYLLPIIFNVAGGIIAYFVLKNRDSVMAKNCLLLGLALIAVQIGLGLLLGMLGEATAATGIL